MDPQVVGTKRFFYCFVYTFIMKYYNIYVFIIRRLSKSYQVKVQQYYESLYSKKF